MKRVPELDALRGLAALAILIFHLDPMAFPMGWTGVDLFFVLSGYLITDIILRYRDRPGFLRNFYVRRGLRIWPIYYLTLLALVVANPWLPRPYNLEGLPYYLLYLQNTPLYWGGRVPEFNEAFDHTWTLALEEQFYLIWPALLLVLPRRAVLPACVATALFSMVARAGFEIYFIRPIVVPALMERLLLARCDGFAMGGLLAALLNDQARLERHRIWFQRGFLVSFLATGAYLLIGFVRRGPLFLGLPTPANPALTIFLIEVFYFSVVGLVLTHVGSRYLAPLRLRALVGLGLISYGVYMYHSPLYWAIDGFGVVQTWIYDQPWTTKVLKVSLSIAVATASWFFIEKPTLRLKDRFAYEVTTETNPTVASTSPEASSGSETEAGAEQSEHA